MVDDKDNDQSLNGYLQDDSDLSRRYRAVSKDTPPEHADHAILAAARKSVASRPRPVVSFMQHWGRPLKFAAVVVICVSLVIAIYDEEGHMILTEPERSLPDTTPLQTDAESDQALPSRAAEFDDQANKIKDMTNGGRSAGTVSEPSPVQDSEKTGGKMIWERKKQIDTRDALQKESGVPPTQKRLDEESLDLMQEERTPPLKRELDAPGIMEEELPPGSISPGKAEEDWLMEISQLWQRGERELAIARLEQFLKIYPDYPHDELVQQLPANLDPAEYIEGFEPD